MTRPQAPWSRKPRKRRPRTPDGVYAKLVRALADCGLDPLAPEPLNRAALASICGCTPQTITKTLTQIRRDLEAARRASA